MNATPSIFNGKKLSLRPTKALIKVLFEVAIFRHTKGEMRSILTYVSNFALKYNAKRALQKDFYTVIISFSFSAKTSSIFFENLSSIF